ncbi:MAG: isopentenyl-diphosphate Delta-isomerase [Terracoccus sp.]
MTGTTVGDVVELVVLLSDDGHAVGTAPKATVHDAHTPLHLAFSLYLFDEADRLLVTRRALDKVTFPGVWTNTACGHPAPGERLEEAAARRARDELGLDVGSDELRLVLPQFAYRAEMDGVVENELCPVFVGRVGGSPDTAPHPAEVASTEWVPWADFSRDVLAGERTVSLWCGLQVAALTTLGGGPADWPDGDPALLPPACPR